MCRSKVSRSQRVEIAIVGGQSSYTFNTTAFKDKIITRLVVIDSTGSGLLKSVSNATLMATSVVTQSYITLVSAVQTSDQVIQAVPTYRFMPTIGNAFGVGIAQYDAIQFDGSENFDMQQSNIFWPDATVLASLSGQVVLLEIEYEDLPIVTK